MVKSDLSLFIPPILSQIETLLSHKIKVVMVFDGGKLLSKVEEENSREETRNQKQAKAKELLLAGDKEAAYKKFAESVDVTPDLAMLLFKVVKAKYNVICIISPYEADAQLAYLSRIGFIDAIITEDSDLLCFGAKKVLYKFNNKGFLKEIELNDWRKCKEFDFKEWTFEQFLSLCILSGCDYLPSLKNIGFKKAYKGLNESRTVENLFKRWRMDTKLGFSDEYQEKFYKAFLTFKFQRVFCPILRKLSNVNELNIEIFEKTLKEAGNGNSLGKVMGNFEFLSPILLGKLKSFKENEPGLEFLGKEINDDMACDIADGMINPISLKEYEEEKLHFEGLIENYRENPEKSRNFLSLENRKLINGETLKNLQKKEENKGKNIENKKFEGRNLISLDNKKIFIKEENFNNFQIKKEPETKSDILNKINNILTNSFFRDFTQIFSSIRG